MKELKFYKPLKKLALIIAGLLIIQTATFFSFAHGQLEDKLMNDVFSDLSRYADSVYVCDFYVSDCYVGDDNIYASHHLENSEEEVKRRLGVNFVKFVSRKNFSWSDPEKEKYNLVYHTWTAYDSPIRIWTLFSATQVEEMKIKRLRSKIRPTTVESVYYESKVEYRWFLFLWVKTFEHFTTLSKDVED